VAQEAVTLLENLGITIAHDWMLQYDPSKPETKEESIKICANELLELEYAKGLLMILPGGRGAHVELGYAFAKDIPVVFYSITPEPDWIAFYGKRKIHFDLKDAIMDLLGQMLKEQEDDQ
jgi:nucleoside 2-deoxyribosyltransferase